MKKFFTSIRLTKGVGHDRVGFWQDHAKNGDLMVTQGTGELLLNLLKEHAEEWFVEDELWRSRRQNRE